MASLIGARPTATGVHSERCPLSYRARVSPQRLPTARLIAHLRAGSTPLPLVGGLRGAARRYFTEDDRRSSGIPFKVSFELIPGFYNDSLTTQHHRAV